MGLMGNCSDDGYPDWLNYLSGVLGQYIDDISLGAYSKYFLHLDNIDVAVFQEGRNLGHSVALIQAMVEVVVGIAAVEAALLSIPPTVGGGTLCAATTLGACLVIVIPAVSAEVIVLVNGTALTLHGAGVLVRAALDGGGGGGAGSNPSKKLGDNMVKAGRDRPPHSHAHHIVAWNEELAKEAREILKRAKIGINEEINGAWLPDRFHWKIKDSYYDQVNVILRKAEADGTVKETLRWLGDSLVDGYFP